jgi:dTDP-4-dehydrorhamnose 3,5-epimerase
MSVEDICITPLKKILVEGGNVLHAIKHSESNFQGFGEAYFSFVNYKHVKAWKKHMLMTLNLVVPIGNVKFVFYDGHNFKEETIGENNYNRITVPPGIWFGFSGHSKSKNIVLNIANLPHDPSEVMRKKISEIHFNWEV